MENSTKHLHVISFAIPYPASYGGVIDVFYKIRALALKGVKIHLHNFIYGDRKPEVKLTEFCESVHYYHRKTGLQSAFSVKPYIVKSRESEELVENLLNDDYPILFEGLHSCGIIDDKRLQGRKKIYREANIEHHYYYSLFKADKNIGNKLYFLLESLRLYLFQKILVHADLMVTVSQSDKDYLENNFPNKDVHFIPCFHANNAFDILTGKGDYALYHGNLSVAENEKAALYLIRSIFSKTQIPFIIAGKEPTALLKKQVEKYSNVSLFDSPDDATMNHLIQNAHVNMLVTFQGTGLKLKLLNTLFKGRFNLVNQTMLNGSGLEKACIVANTKETQLSELIKLFEKSFTDQDIRDRKKHLNSYYSNIHNAEKLIHLIY